MATHNGAPFMREKLESLFALNYPQEKIEVIIIDDASTDDTISVVRAIAGDRVRLVTVPKGGKAAAVNEGLRLARNEILVLTDVRQQLHPDSLRYMMENFADQSVGVVSAELQIRSGATHEEINTGAYWKYEKWIRLNLSAVDSIFGATGSLYAVRRELATPMPPNTLNDDMYLPLHAFFRGFRLIVDGRAKMFDYPTNLASEFGRKVRTLAGNYQILGHYPQLLSPKNRMLPHYCSYKLGRLFLPFAMLICAISSFFLGRELAIASATMQAFVCALAFADPNLKAGNPIKKLSSPLRSFLVMMIATVCAVSIWFVPPERLWKPTRVSQAKEMARS